MKKYKTVKRIKEEKELSSMTCDMCGKTIKCSYWQDDPHKEDPSNYFNTETTVKYEYGVSYPDDGGGTMYHYDLDICPHCFMKYIVKKCITKPIPEEVDF